MDKFKNLIVLGPLIYAIHHFEEHIIFNFRVWRLKYFPDSNSIPTEAILAILISLLLIFIFIHLVNNNRASAHVVLYFLMTAQVVNAIFHIFFSFYFSDFSPGTVTAILLYLPVNFIITRSAFRQGYLKSYFEYGCIFFLGAITFILFEIIGPIIISLSIIMSFTYYLLFKNRLN